MKYTDILIHDFTDARFQKAFRQYFHELGMNVKNWDGLFAEMNEQEGNGAFLRLSGEGEVIGFLQFQPGELTHWFFREPVGFIREFWIAGPFRGKGHGGGLLALTETYFKEQGLSRVLLTADEAEPFYLHHGYRKEPRILAKNNMDVFEKQLL